MLDHPKIPHIARVEIDATDNLYTSQDSNILAIIHGGAKEPRDAEPARAKADKLRVLYLQPSLGCLKFLPRVVDLWLGLGIHGGQVSSSQQALVLGVGGEAKPELELGNVANFASEGQRPLAHFTPRVVLTVGGLHPGPVGGAGVARRVQAVGAVTVYGYADLRASFDDSVGADF